eukprot:6587008-Pyramimonas_sp.AAC.1
MPSHAKRVISRGRYGCSSIPSLRRGLPGGVGGGTKPDKRCLPGGVGGARNLINTIVFADSPRSGGATEEGWEGHET